MGHDLMATAGAVLVATVVAAAPVPRRTVGRVGRRNSDGVVIAMVAVHVMQVSVVKVIGVTVVSDGLMATAGPVNVCVTVVLVAAHGLALAFVLQVGVVFLGMRQSGFHQGGHVGITQSVINVLALASTCDQLFGP